MLMLPRKELIIQLVIKVTLGLAEARQTESYLFLFFIFDFLSIFHSIFHSEPLLSLSSLPQQASFFCIIMVLLSCCVPKFSIPPPRVLSRRCSSVPFFFTHLFFIVFCFGRASIDAFNALMYRGFFPCAFVYCPFFLLHLIMSVY